MRKKNQGTVHANNEPEDSHRHLETIKTNNLEVHSIYGLSLNSQWTGVGIAMVMSEQLYISR